MYFRSTSFTDRNDETGKKARPLPIYAGVELDHDVETFRNGPVAKTTDLKSMFFTIGGRW
jgi:hypothetical protein